MERFIQLARPNGIVGIILPQGIFSALPLRYVRAFVMDKASVLGIVSLPRRIFSNGTTSKTSILFAQKGKSKPQSFMAIARHLDDLPQLLEAYVKHQQLDSPPAFWVNLNADSFEPEFYWTSKAVYSSILSIIPAAELLSVIRLRRD